MSSEHVREPGSPVTITDVAAHLGLSIATVSRAINGRTGVAPATVARVEHAVRELGFSPRHAARQLQGRRSRAISLLFPTDTEDVEAYDIDFVLGAAKATGERDYFFNLHLEQLEADGLFAMYRSGLVDGVVLMQVQLDDWRVEALAREGMPFTMIGRTADAAVASYVDFDFDRAVGLAVDHLCSLGHEVIGLLGRPGLHVRRQLGSAVRLERAFHRECEQRGAAPLVMASGLDRLSAAHGIRRLLDSSPSPTALITTHGHGAVAALRLAREGGTAIPEQLSLIAIGTDRGLDLLEPMPSTITFPAVDLGYRAAAMLIDHLEAGPLQEPRTPEQLLLPTELRLRGSTARPLGPSGGTP